MLPFDEPAAVEVMAWAMAGVETSRSRSTERGRIGRRMSSRERPLSIVALLVVQGLYPAAFSLLAVTVRVLSFAERVERGVPAALQQNNVAEASSRRYTLYQTSFGPLLLD